MYQYDPSTWHNLVIVTINWQFYDQAYMHVCLSLPSPPLPSPPLPSPPLPSPPLPSPQVQLGQVDTAPVSSVLITEYAVSDPTDFLPPSLPPSLRVKALPSN